MAKAIHCPECGRFGNKEVIEDDGWCAECINDSVDEIMREEREFDPYGPCGDGSRLR